MGNEQTKKCKHCQTDIPKKAKVCPNCRRKQGGALKWVIIAFIGIGIIGAAGGDDDNAKTTQTASDSKPQKVSTVAEESVETQNEKVDNEFVVGDVVETSNLKISYISSGEYISDNEFIQPKDGHMYYRFEFEFENISKTDQAISSILNWGCYADDYSMNQSWIGDDVIDTTLSPGKKAKGAVYYEVPVDAEKIVLEYETNFWSEDKVVFIGK